MNLEVLEHIVTNDPGYIETLAEENGLDETASLGIARFLIGNNGDLSKLTQRQIHHYKKCIKPLIEDVPCEGVFGPEEPDSCSSGGIIDDDSLLTCYMLDDFKCQHCRYDAEKM
jgi:hypothetical protein